jgi:hypothetical protein
MKDKSKQRTNWLRQERNSKGHFMPYKKESEEKQIIPASLDHNEDGSKVVIKSFSTLEELQKMQSEKYGPRQIKQDQSFYQLKPDWVNYRQGKEDGMKEAEDKFIDSMQHAFYAGLKANNSFYPPSKLWEFYKRDRGLE